MRRLDRALSISLIIAILAVIGAIGYMVANPRVEKFTEFYILGLEGHAADYPRNLLLGKEGRVILGIVNREHELLTYRVEIIIEGVKNSEIKSIVLDHNEKWEEIISFTPDQSGEDKKVEFLLYKDDEIKTYRAIYLWIDVMK